MKRGYQIGLAIVLGLCGAAVLAQDAGPGASNEISPGFKLRPDGVIDIGPLYAEVTYYDGDWAIAQQHDKFQVSEQKSPTTAPTAHVIEGTLTTAGGPLMLKEEVDAVDGGVDYTVAASSEKELNTNELSVSFLLSTEAFGGKQVMVDKEPVALAAEAAKKGESLLTAKDDAHEIQVPLPNGTLTITGDFKVLLQDDREWGDSRYSLRLHFTPASGQIKDSKIELKMRLKPTAK